ncbi:hypothetical protein [Candidatus Karelsulcia muelleri]|uniref:hypothetical protein n=1 Tax=Candidatus Karelsulcia muelleri TaxID=336810 RepID=UPI00164B7751|nr:hypothetical protein [Candidatus Karelsulcia muelleri]
MEISENMYILNQNSEFLFYKLLSNYYLYKKNLLSDIFINVLNKYKKYLCLKKRNNIIVKNKPNRLNILLLIKLIHNFWKIKYISERGFLYIENIKYLNTSFLHYKKVNIYSSNGIILPGLIIPNQNYNTNYKKSNTKSKLKIDIGVETMNEVYELGITYNSLIFLTDSLSILNKKYLVSNHISSKLGLFIFLEIISSFKKNTNINFILYNNLKNKTLILKNKIKIIITLNRSKRIGIIFINKDNLEKILFYCQKTNIICYINNYKINTYFVTLNVKYLNTPNEMIKKKDLEKIIQFFIWIFTEFN